MEIKVTQLKLPGFEDVVKKAAKRGHTLTQVPYQGRVRIIAGKRPPDKK